MACVMQFRLRLLAIWILCMMASTYAAARMLYCVFKNPSKAWVMAIAHDQLANAAFNGNPDETISSRAYRSMNEGRSWGCILCKILDLLERDHCSKSSGQ